MTKRKNIVAFVLLSVFLSICIFYHFSTIGRVEALQTCAKSMIVIERDTHRILAKKDEKTRLPMASTTKIATAITVNTTAFPQTITFGRPINLCTKARAASTIRLR